MAFVVLKRVVLKFCHFFYFDNFLLSIIIGGMAKVLVVDDEKDIAELVSFNLQKRGHTVQLAYDGQAGLNDALQLRPDLIVLDQMMPIMDGKTVFRELKRDARTMHIPIIFLTAKSQTEDRIQGLELGADDYVTKPFSPKELVLRIEAVLKRSENAPGSVEVTCGPFRFDKNNLKFYVDGSPVELTSTEFKLLVHLVERNGKVLDRADLLRNVWGYSELVQSRTLDTHMKRVRQKLEPYADCIETIRSVGYRFTLPV